MEVDFKKLDQMYVYLCQAGKEIDPDRHNAYKRLAVNFRQAAYIRLCFEYNPELNNICWFAEDAQGNPTDELIVRCSWDYYTKKYGI